MIIITAELRAVMKCSSAIASIPSNSIVTNAPAKKQIHHKSSLCCSTKMSSGYQLAAAIAFPIELELLSFTFKPLGLFIFMYNPFLNTTK